MLLKSATLMSSGSCTIKKVTPSEHGGVVSEPVYWRMSDDSILASTSLKSMPPAIAVLVPGVAILDTEEERDRIIELDSPAETWNISATTASWVGSATRTMLVMDGSWIV